VALRGVDPRLEQGIADAPVDNLAHAEGRRIRGIEFEDLIELFEREPILFACMAGAGAFQ
jgi:hypothetical protein